MKATEILAIAQIAQTALVLGPEIADAINRTIATLKDPMTTPEQRNAILEAVKVGYTSLPLKPEDSSVDSAELYDGLELHEDIEPDT